MNRKNNIVIITNSLFDDLYRISKSFYDDMLYEKLVISGKNNFYGLNFLNDIIINKMYSNIDIMVYIDEDCFITDIKELNNIIEFFIENDLDCIGMPDGGVVSIRSHNPLSINQFFCILNLKKIRKKYDIDNINKTSFTENLIKYQRYDLLKFNYKYDDFEPYYKLFFWMLNNNFNFLYLDAEVYNDSITTILKSHNNINFAYHSWYGRKWNESITKNRIINLVNNLKINIKK